MFYSFEYCPLSIMFQKEEVTQTTKGNVELVINLSEGNEELNDIPSYLELTWSCNLVSESDLEAERFCQLFSTNAYSFLASNPNVRLSFEAGDIPEGKYNLSVTVTDARKQLRRPSDTTSAEVTIKKDITDLVVSLSAVGKHFKNGFPNNRIIIVDAICQNCEQNV